MNRKIIILGIFLIVIILIGLFIFKDRKERALYEAELVPSRPIEITDTKIVEAIEQSNFIKPGFGGKTFFAYEKLGIEKSNSRTNVYVWLYAQEYYEKNNQLLKGTGVSLPVVLYFNNDTLSAINAPRAGSLYHDDIQNIFPDFIKSNAVFWDTEERDAIIQQLQKDVNTQATATSTD